MSDSIPQSDVSRPSALPTASLLQRTSAAARLAQSQAQNSAQYLNEIEEEWNKKVDTEIEALVDGMVDIVSIASVSCLNTSSVTVREVQRVRDWRERQVSDGTRGVPNSMPGRVDGM
jgi:phage-related minor tail protein